MRVLHLQKIAGVAGSERHLLALLPRLAAAGVEVEMCALAAPGSEEFTDQLEDLGVPVTTLAAGPDVNPALVPGLVRAIRRFEPDLVHTHLIHADLHGQLAARIARTRAVSSVHGAASFYRRPPYRVAGRFAGSSSRLTIAISAYVKDFLEQMRVRPPGKVRVVHYGIDASLWDSDEEQRSAARLSLGLGQEEFAVGIASRLIPHKGHDLLLEAAVQAGRDLPELRLLIAGDGPIRADLERQAERLGSGASFLGFIPDVARFMLACDVLAFPSQPQIGEGFGLAALEAMATGRPVIATDACSLPEVVADGETGLLVRPASADDLARAMLSLGRDRELRSQMGVAARRRAEQEFSLEAMVAGTVAVYEEALR